MIFRPRGSPKSRTHIVIPQTLVNAVWDQYPTISDRLEIMTTIQRFIVEQKRLGVSDEEILEHLQREEDDLNDQLSLKTNNHELAEAIAKQAQEQRASDALKSEVEELKKSREKRGNREVVVEALKLAISTATLFFFR